MGNEELGTVNRLKIRIVGTSPLLMHNVQAADPLHPDNGYLAEIAKKRNKSQTDMVELSAREWKTSIYRVNGRPHMPIDNIHSMIYSSSKRIKEGPIFTGSGVRVIQSWFRPGEKHTVDEMWAISQDEDDPRTFVDRRSVKVGQSRLIRTRCRFDEWEIVFELVGGKKFFESDHLDRWMPIAGHGIGLGDYRPQKGGLFGTFEYEIGYEDESAEK